MSRMFINAVKGASKLKLGYPVMSDKYDAVAFVLDPTAPEEILFGTAMMTGDVQGTYMPVKDSGVVVTADNINKVVGFALASNVRVPSVFPNAGPDHLKPGENGECCVSGAIVVKFAGAGEPKEEDKVYIVTASTAETHAVGDITDGETVSNVTKVQLPGWRFMGITDTDEGLTVTAIHKGY